MQYPDQDIYSYTCSVLIMSFTIASRLNKIQLYSDFRCSSSTGHSARRRGAVFVTFIALSLRSTLVWSLHCAHSSGPSSVGHNKWLSSDAYSGVVVGCRSRNLTRFPRYIRSNVTELDFSRNNISTIGKDDFVNMTNLRILVLSNSFITTLEKHCFRNLIHFEQLALKDNDITSLESDVFVGLHSLRVLTMTGLLMTSYPTQFVLYTRQLRVLSLSPIGDATIPAEYARLPLLEVLDFYKHYTETFGKITTAMFDNLRDSNITKLTFRRMSHLKEVEAGAFSNLPNLRSLVLSCNGLLSYRVVMASLAATTNTTIDTVVLDGTQGETALFDEYYFCSPFWHSVKRLSIKCVNLVGFAFKQAGCLANLREVILDYNVSPSPKPMYLQSSQTFAL